MDKAGWTKTQHEALEAATAEMSPDAAELVTAALARLMFCEREMRPMYSYIVIPGDVPGERRRNYANRLKRRGYELDTFSVVPAFEHDPKTELYRLRSDLWLEEMERLRRLRSPRDLEATGAP